MMSCTMCDDQDESDRAEVAQREQIAELERTRSVTKILEMDMPQPDAGKE